MNSLAGNISTIEENGNLCVIKVASGEISLKIIVIESQSGSGYLRIGNEITCVFKEAEVIIGKGDNTRISMENQWPAKVTHIEKGALLTKASMMIGERSINALITTESAHDLDLKIGDQVTAMVKASEIMIAK